MATWARCPACCAITPACKKASLCVSWQVLEDKLCCLQNSFMTMASIAFAGNSWLHVKRSNACIASRKIQTCSKSNGTVHTPSLYLGLKANMQRRGLGFIASHLGSFSAEQGSASADVHTETSGCLITGYYSGVRAECNDCRPTPGATAYALHYTAS